MRFRRWLGATAQASALGASLITGCSTGLSGEGPDPDASILDALDESSSSDGTTDRTEAQPNPDASDGDATADSPQGEAGDGASMDATDGGSDGEEVDGDAASATDVDVGDGGSSDGSADSHLIDDAGDGPAFDASEADAPAAPTCNESSCGRACCGDRCVSSCAGCASGTAFCPFTSLLNANGYCVSACDKCADPGCTP